MILSPGNLRLTLLILAIATVTAGRAAIPIAPELQQAGEAGRNQDIQTRAEASLREKLEVGKQRYQQQQAYRQELIQAMAASAEERRQEISGQSRPPVLDENYEFEWSWIGWALFALGGVHLGIRFYRTHELGDLDFGLHEIPEAATPAPVSSAKAREPDWKDVVSAVHLPSLNEAQRSFSTDLSPIASVKICLNISPSLQSAVSAERVKQHLQELFEPCGLKFEEEARIWLALNIQGNCPAKTTTFSHVEKLVFLDSDSLSRKSLFGAATVPSVLWGAEHTSFAEQPELETDVLTVLQVFAEMFTKSLVSEQTSDAISSPEVAPQFDAVEDALT